MCHTVCSLQADKQKGVLFFSVSQLLVLKQNLNIHASTAQRTQMKQELFPAGPLGLMKSSHDTVYNVFNSWV